MKKIERRDVLAMGAAVLASRALMACGRGVAAGGAKTAPSPVVSGQSWATGGTAAMRDKAKYPNPFDAASTSPSEASGAVKCTCQLTEGPCYSAQAEAIRDISYGYNGVPMRLHFQVIDESGAPVPAATVDVWHVSAVGKYSGSDQAHEDVSFCTGDDAAFSSKLYFRGKQTTDVDGQVHFDTCFPGWYPSRTVHVHLTISVGGKAYVTTQFCFDDALVDSIVRSHAIYGSRGARDTTNTTDRVFDPHDYPTYQLSTAQMSDGAMLAWKSIVLRKSLAEPVCGDSGGHGPPQGPPPPRRSAQSS